jgi:uncharacterized protein (TIGR02996 family)
MTEQAALLAAIAAHPDDDTPRLVYADWLDEHRPDRVASPAAGPSARAEFIRVQCRLAAGAFADRDYPELVEREADLAAWLNTHDPDQNSDLYDLIYDGEFDGGEWGVYRRGFVEVLDFDDWGDDPAATMDNLVAAVGDGFSKCPGRTLRLRDAMAEEIVRLAEHKVFERLRGLYLDYLSEGSEDESVAAIADSPRAAALRRLYLEFPVDADGCAAMAESRHLTNLESLVIGYPISARALKQFEGVRWFQNLRRLHLWLSRGDALHVLSDLPPMPRLVSLTLGAESAAGPVALRRFATALRSFATSDAFPNLAHLDLDNLCLSADHVPLLSRARWPLRHLRLARNEIRKAGAEALTDAAFAHTLRVLDLRGCEITAGGVQALADCPALAGLRHLSLAENPVGTGGLEALAASPYLRNLRLLDLTQTNVARGPIGGRDVAAFLDSLAMPELRHLKLAQLPVGLRGAKILANRPTFANLTRLDLAECALGEAGTKAVVASSTLANLVVLDLSGNKVGAGVGKLANRKLFPRLAYCRLGTGIPRSTATRLRRRPGVRV